MPDATPSAVDPIIAPPAPTPAPREPGDGRTEDAVVREVAAIGAKVDRILQHVGLDASAAADEDEEAEEEEEGVDEDDDGAEDDCVFTPEIDFALGLSPEKGRSARRKS